MPRRLLFFIIAAAPVMILQVSGMACSSSSSSSSSSGGASSGATPSDAGREVDAPRDPNANCVKPGTPNNDEGIGGYCEKQTDCVKGKSACSGTFGAPDNAWFCTRICSTEEPDCGAGLYCAHDPRGVACVPIVCGFLAPPDASDDDASDSSNDANNDANNDADGS